MKRIVSLFFVLILVGCGKNYDPDLSRPQVNTDLTVYVNRFVQVAESMGRPVYLGRIQIDFVETMEGSVIGKCYAGYMTPRIEINRSYWNRSGVSNSDRESLVFHELGHCVLGRGHDNRGIPGYDWLNISVMNAYHLESVYYENNWEYYMRELFGLPFYFSLSATSQFPSEYYSNPGLVPVPDNNPPNIFCKSGSDCDPIVSATSMGMYEKVYATSEDEIHKGFHCGEAH